MSNLLNKKYAFAKLRAKLKRKKEKICWYCKKFGHLAYNCKNKKEGVERKTVPKISSTCCRGQL